MIDWQQIALGYLLCGLIALYIMIQEWKQDNGYDELIFSLGYMVALSLVGWPYVLIVWVFGWPIWVTPIRLNFWVK